MEFKNRLRDLRTEKKIPQNDLAKVLNYGCTAISNYESGRNEPSISDLKKIAEYFDVSMDYLLCVNDVKNPYAKRDYPESFDHLKNIYSALDEEDRKTINDFALWLYEKSSQKSASSMKVAQNVHPYKSHSKKEN